ncbi:MAG: PAS domain S-box protein [Chthoniobacteraceae bacterium]|nr:PAS domain S-box protein [Chthoniobacteraceae bacterium]
MSPSDPPSPLLHRVRDWLFDKNGLRGKLLCSLTGSVLAMLCLSLLFSVAMRQVFHGKQGSAGVGEYLRLAGYWVSGLMSIGALGASTWYIIRTYRDRLWAVEQAEARAWFIIESCPDAIVMVDSQGVIELCNAATELLFGYPRGQLLGEKISKLIPQRHFLFDVAAMGRENFMAFAEKRNAVRFPVEIAVSEADYEHHRRFVVLIHDASERRYSDETVHHISLSVSSTTGVEYVRTLVQQLSLALQNDYAFIVETDTRPEAGFCSLTLAESGRLRSKTNYGLQGTVFAEALKNGFTAIVQGVRAQYPADNLLASLRAESFIATPLIDQRERIVGLIGVIGCNAAAQIGIARQTLQIFAARAAAEIERKQEVEGLASEKDRLAGDVNVLREGAERDRVRYEDEIAAEQELLEVTLCSIREGCITTDNDGRIVTLNPVAERLTGWMQKEAEDKPLNEILHLTSIRGNRPLDTLRLSEKALQTEPQSMVVARDGTQRRVEMSAAPIRARKNLKLGTVLVLRDVTDKQFLEEERYKAEKLESIGVAAGGIAHDFNNLLTAVIGNLSLSLMGAQGSVRDRIEASKNAALRAQDLARQLLTFAKGGAPIKRTASLRQLVLDTVGFSLSGTNIRSCFDLPADLWPADIDAGQISQVISNLAVNAVQVMERGGTLYVSGENLVVNDQNAPPTLEPGRYVKINVRDEGPGIPEDIQKKIFDPYFTTKPTGNGLGLATSYSIVKNHDGFIGVESPAGQGAIFHLYLPASEKEVEQVVKRPAARTVRHGKILVLDDEEVICELVSYTLTSCGYTVIPSYNAETTLRLYKEALDAGQPFDLVIMDLTIPGGMGGREAIQELRKIDPNVKAVVSSGYAMDAIMTQCRDYGFCGAIPKPFDLSQLEICVQEALAT